MRVAVIDVGSNTARLLVADVDRVGGCEAVAEDRVYLRLGAALESSGSLGSKKLKEAARVCARFAGRAAKLDADRATAIITAPGRDPHCGKKLAQAIAAATGLEARVLSGEEEGSLAFDGALARTQSTLNGVVAVVDIGGGSTEIAVGTARAGAEWVRSIEIGALRLSRALLQGDPPTKSDVAAAARHVTSLFADVAAPAPDVVLAVGGSARAVARIAGRTFDTASLEEVVRIVSRRSAARVARRFEIDPARAETVLAGALLLAEVSRVLGMPLELGRGGLREGAALELATSQVAAAA